MADDYGDGWLGNSGRRHKEKGVNSGVWLTATDHAMLLQLQAMLQSRSTIRVTLSDVLRQGLRTLASVEGIAV